MISELLLYNVIKLKLNTELMRLHSYKATNGGINKLQTVISAVSFD